jgi:nucleoside-diphosphate-sugar epimerase
MLGQFLLRDCLFAGLPVVVLARNRRLFTAQQRVEQIIFGFEQTSQRYLPRPLVLAGDIHQPMLGLSAVDTDWVARNCDTVLHSAASVKFHAEASDRNGNDSYAVEPYHSNVVGTRNLLEFCRHTQIVNFHHISTAYVCGKQSGPVCESPAQHVQFGNDYEASKAEAETLVQQAAFLKSKTILRPSIIVGDSQSGYTPAFHGIYTALQLGYLFLIGILRAGITELTPEVIESATKKYFVEQLGLEGHEQKNLVPVDWVSAVILKVVQAPELHGNIYHITNPKPITSAEIIASMQAAILDSQPQSNDLKTGVPSELLELEGFRTLMDTYRSYFGNDPQFDSTHTQAIPTASACPELDHPTLVKLWKYAIRAEFAARKNLKAASPVNVDALLTAVCVEQSPGVEKTSTIVDLQVNGPGGGRWHIGWEKNGWEEDEAGSVPMTCCRAEVKVVSDLQLHLNSRDLAALLNGQITVESAFYSGQLYVQSTSLNPDEIQLLVQKLFDALRFAISDFSRSSQDEIQSACSPHARPASKGTSI